MKSHRKNRSRAMGFTRGDLLAVTAIVLLLALVQLPSFGNTKSGGQAALCQSNLRKLIQAWTMYADDNQGKITPNYGHVGEGGPGANQKSWVSGWLDFTSSYDNINTDYLVNFEKSGNYGHLGPYLKRDVNAFKCPSDRSTTVIFGRIASRVRSVSMNYRMGGDAWAGQTEFSVFRRLDDITGPGPDNALVILDEREDSINDCAFYINMLTNIVDYPGSYHDGGANLAYADGHVAYRYWEDPRTTPVLDRGSYLPLDEPMPNNPDLDFLRSVATAPK